MKRVQHEKSATRNEYNMKKNATQKQCKMKKSPTRKSVT